MQEEKRKQTLGIDQVAGMGENVKKCVNWKRGSDAMHPSWKILVDSRSALEEETTRDCREMERIRMSQRCVPFCPTVKICTLSERTRNNYQLREDKCVILHQGLLLNRFFLAHLEVLMCSDFTSTNRSASNGAQAWQTRTAGAGVVIFSTIALTKSCSFYQFERECV